MQWPETQATMIARLRDPEDRRTWEEFVAMYSPAIYRFARRQGLQDADADEITQRVLCSVAAAIEGWEPDPARGRFRAWLAQVTRNAVINLVTRDHRQQGTGRSSIVDRLEATDDSSIENQWKHEQRVQRFRVAAEHVRPTCTEAVWNAFWRTTVDDQPIAEVATQLGMSVGAVYAARSRVLKRLRDAAGRIEELESHEL